jgi:hypothetical protein
MLFTFVKAWSHQLLINISSAFVCYPNKDNIKVFCSICDKFITFCSILLFRRMLNDTSLTVSLCPLPYLDV